MKLASLAAALALLPELALANTINPNVIGRGGFQGAAITTSSQVIIGPGSILSPSVENVSSFLYLENESATATICIAFGQAATISGTACAAGEITLQPGAFRFFDTAVPADSVQAIGSASGALTVGAQ